MPDERMLPENLRCSIDVEMTLKAIKLFLDVSDDKDQLERLHIYATIKTLCDALHATNEEEKVWAGDGYCLLIDLVSTYARFAGILPELPAPPPLPLAQTALSSFESSYSLHKA